MASSEFQGLRIAIYARFSSSHQREASIDDQVRRCREYVEERGGTVVEDLIFADRAVSGASMERPAFMALSMLATSTPPGIDVIVAEDLSRIGRDQADLHNFNRLIEYSGVRLIGIADGIDTASASSALTFGMKSVIDSIYRKQLGDKTLRGLQGRALAGFATGGVAYGYTLRKQVDAFGKSIGSRIEVVEERAKVVRRIFDLYLEGKSIAGIARILNDEKIPPPRVYAKRRRAGWKDSTIRNILRNETYAGVVRYGEKKWRKFPGTNKRRYTAADATRIVTKQREDLRIVSADVWSEVKTRSSAISAHYTRTTDGKPKGRSIPGRPSRYLFSSLLHCGVCGDKMVISGGNSSTSYYRCQSHSKRGTCENALSVRETDLKASLLSELHRRLASDQGLAYARKQVAVLLGKDSRRRNQDLVDAEGRLAKLEREIDQLVQFVADGNGSKAIAGKLKTAEANADLERRKIKSLEQRTEAPIRLPAPDEVLSIVFDLEARLTADVGRGREELRRLFRDGRIDLIPQPGGFYVAKSALLPLVLLVPRPLGEGAEGRSIVSRYSASSCAGRI